MPLDQLDDDSKYITDDSASAPKKRRTTYDSNQPTDTDWSLGRMSEVQDWYAKTFPGKKLPVVNMGQGSIHNKLGFDHRESSDVGLNPTTPDGQALIKQLRAMNAPFLAFDRAIPGVATGPHIHIGRPSHHTDVKYSVGAQVKRTVQQRPADDDAKYITDGATTDDDSKYVTSDAQPTPTPDITKALDAVTQNTNRLTAYAGLSEGDTKHHFGITADELEKLPAKQRDKILSMSAEAAAEDMRKRQGGQTEFPVDIGYQNANRRKAGLPPIDSSVGALRQREDQLAGQGATRAAEFGPLRQSDETEVARRQRIAAQVAAHHQGPGQYNENAVPGMLDEDTINYKVAEERHNEDKAAEHQARIREIASTFTERDKAELAAAHARMTGQGSVNRGIEIGSQVVGSGLMYKLAGLVEATDPRNLATRAVPGSGALARAFDPLGEIADRKTLANFLRRQAARGEVSIQQIESEMPPDRAQRWSKFITQSIGALPEIFAATTAAGPVGGFAALGGLEAQGRGAPLTEVAQETAKGAAIGSVFKFAPLAESPVVEGVEKGIGQRMADIGRSAVPIALGTYGTERAFGASHEDAIQSVVQNLMFHGVARSVDEAHAIIEQALKSPEPEPLGPTVPPETQNRLQAADIARAGGELTSEPGMRPRFKVSDEKLAEMQGVEIPKGVEQPIEQPVVEEPIAAAPPAADAKYITENRSAATTPPAPETSTENAARMAEAKAKLAGPVAEVGQPVTHSNPDIHGKPIVAKTDDGRVVVPNEANKSGVSVVKPRTTLPGDYVVVNRADRQIDSVYSRDVAAEAGFHHEKFMSPADAEGVSSGEKVVFVRDKSGTLHNWRTPDDLADGEYTALHEAASKPADPAVQHLERLRQLQQDLASLHEHEARGGKNVQLSRQFASGVSESAMKRYFQKLWEVVDRVQPESTHLVNEAEMAWNEGNTKKAIPLTEKALSLAHNAYTREVIESRKSGISNAEIQGLKNENWKAVIDARKRGESGFINIGDITAAVTKLFDERRANDHQDVGYELKLPGREPVRVLLNIDRDGKAILSMGPPDVSKNVDVTAARADLGTDTVLALKHYLLAQHPDIKRVIATRVGSTGGEFGRFVDLDVRARGERWGERGAVDIGDIAKALTDLRKRFPDKSESELRGELPSRQYAAWLKSVPESVRDDIEFSENYAGYSRYEAEKLMPKQPGDLKFRKLTDRNSHQLWQDAEYVANVKGEPYLLNKWEDPDAPDDHPKVFVWAFEPLGEKSVKPIETSTMDPAEVMREMEAHLTKQQGQRGFLDVGEMAKALSDLRAKFPDKSDDELRAMLGPTQKDRSLPKTLAESGREPGTNLTYEQLPNAKTLDKVTDRLAKEGPDALELWYRDAPASAERSATHQVLVDHLQTESTKAANPDDAAALRARAVDLSNLEVERATTAGQAVQAYSMLNKYTPAGIALEIAKAKGKGVKVGDADAAAATEAAVEHDKADKEVEKRRKKVEDLEAAAGEGKGPGKGPGAGRGKGSGKGEYESVVSTVYRRRTPKERPTDMRTLQGVLKDLAPTEQLREAAERMIGDTDLSRWMRETKAKYNMSAEDATKLGQQAHALLKKARAESANESKMARLRKKYPDASTDELVLAREQLDTALARRRAAKTEMARFFDKLSQKQQGYYRRSMNITRAMMVSAFSTAMRNAQSQAVRFGLERMTDLTENIIRKSIGMESDFTTRSIARNSLRALSASERSAREIAGEHPAELARLFNNYAGGVEVPQLEHGPIANRVHQATERLFGGMEKAAKVVNFANQLQEFHLRSAEFLSTLDLHLRKDHDMTLERFVGRYGADAIPKEIVTKAVDRALEVTFADSPGREGLGGRLLGDLIEVGNYIPPTVSPIAFPKFMFNSLKFLYQYNPTGMIDLARSGQNKPRVIAKALLGSTMLLTAYGFRKSEYAGEKWYELKLGGHTFDTRPFGPFSTYLFLGEALRRARTGEPHFTLAEIAEAIGASSGPGGTGIAVAEKLYNYSMQGQWDKFQRVLKTEAGDFGRALLTPVRQLKDLVAAFDPAEGFTRDTSEQPFVGAIEESIPGLSRNLPVAGRPTSATPIHQEHPAIKALTGWRVETPKTYLEQQLDALHFDPSEIRSTTGLPKIDEFEKRAMGPLMDQLSQELESDPDFKTLGPAQRADIIKDHITDIRNEVRDMGKSEMPDEYERLKEERKPARKKALEEELNSPGLSKAMKLGVPMGVPARQPNETDIAYRARLLQTGRARRGTLDTVASTSGFHNAPPYEQRKQLHAALSA